MGSALASYLAAMGIIFALLAGFIAVDRAYRRFAIRHPALAPYRGEGGGCGGGCRCGEQGGKGCGG